MAPPPSTSACPTTRLVVVSDGGRRRAAVADDVVWKSVKPGCLDSGCTLAPLPRGRGSATAAAARFSSGRRLMRGAGGRGLRHPRSRRILAIGSGIEGHLREAG